jgi:membrane-associated phospholipid phosphatase
MRSRAIITLSGWAHRMALTAAMTYQGLFQLGKWLLLFDYGAVARRNMVAAWACIAGLSLVVFAWLPMSGLVFDPATWPGLTHSLIYAVITYVFYLVVSQRLRHQQGRVAIFLRAALERFALLFRSCVLIAAIGSVGLIFTYLATAAALPLKDGLLAILDQRLGFHWLSFLGAANDHPRLATLLTQAYGSTALLTQGVVLWLAFRGNAERLSEFLALLCLSSVGLAVGMVLIPAAGANVYFAPQPQLFDNFASDGKLWGFLDAFHGLRNGSLRTIDMSSVQGVVSFPSFHTMLGVITIYALRDTRALLFPAILLNGTMIVATLPVGGHYLVDVVAGAVVCIAGIQVLRYAAGHGQRTRQSVKALSINEIS